MRVALYARVSTSNHGQDVGMQTRELREYCERRGWEIAGEYVDSGISGTKERRPELDRLMADAKRRKFDAVIVYRYDRFARSLRHLVNALGEFDALGIHFISLHEGVDTSTPNGRLVFGIFASIAQFERELTVERIKSGLRNARSKGHHPGPVPQRVDVSRLRQLLDSGVSLRQASAQLGISHATALRRLRAAA